MPTPGYLQRPIAALVVPTWRRDGERGGEEEGCGGDGGGIDSWMVDFEDCFRRDPETNLTNSQM